MKLYNIVGLTATPRARVLVQQLKLFRYLHQGKRRRKLKITASANAG